MKFTEKNENMTLFEKLQDTFSGAIVDLIINIGIILLFGILLYVLAESFKNRKNN